MSLVFLRPLSPREQAEIVVQGALYKSCEQFIGTQMTPHILHAVKAAVNAELQHLYVEMKLPAGVEVSRVEVGDGGRLDIKIDYPDPMMPF